MATTALKSSSSSITVVVQGVFIYQNSIHKIMTNLIDVPKLHEFLEKQSKTSSGIMLLICYTALGIGLLFMYASTIDVIIKDRVLFGLGGVLGSMSFCMLALLYSDIRKKERRLLYQRQFSTVTQMLKDDLDLRIKLIEYRGGPTITKQPTDNISCTDIKSSSSFQHPFTL